MAYLLDTSVAILLCDTQSGILDTVAALGDDVSLSIISQVELVNGIYKYPEQSSLRKQRVDILLASYGVHDFTDETMRHYEAIIAYCGFSRSRILDRMIAATAIAHDLSLVTMNGRDFSDIPNLKLVGW